MKLYLIFFRAYQEFYFTRSFSIDVQKISLICLLADQVDQAEYSEFTSSLAKPAGPFWSTW